MKTVKEDLIGGGIILDLTDKRSTIVILEQITRDRLEWKKLVKTLIQ